MSYEQVAVAIVASALGLLVFVGALAGILALIKIILKDILEKG